MKEQQTEIQSEVIEQSVGQRPIHVSYEPPEPLPQFRRRPKLRHTSVSTRRRLYPLQNVKPAEDALPATE